MRNHDAEPLAMLAKLIVFVNVITSSSSTLLHVPDESFTSVSQIQQQLCPSTDESTRMECCGFCSMKQYCHTTNACCLQSYKSFEHVFYLRPGRLACVIPEIINEDRIHWRPDNAKAVMMATQCVYEYLEAESVSYVIRELCENPALVYDIDIALPVYVYSTGSIPTTYKNKFCAQCSEHFTTENVFVSGIDIRCEKAIAAFESDEDILSLAVRAHCNIYFNLPKSNLLQPCHIPSYSISECNVTGLWAEFNSSINDACNSFLDPFNKTYKNYFCYLCNSNNPVPFEEWSCVDPFLNQGEKEAPFSYSMSFEVLQQRKKQGSLKCNNITQFTDLKLMVCRDLKCDHLVLHKNCTPKLGTIEDTCLVVYIRFTFGMDQEMLESDITQSYFLDAFTYTLETYFAAGHLLGMSLYKNVSVQNGKMLVDYVVARLYINSLNAYLRLREYGIIARVHGRACYVGKTNGTTAYIRVPLCEFAVYEYSVSDFQESLRVPNYQDLSIDTLQPFHKVVLNTNKNLCEGANTKVISKLDYCLHIDLRFDELPMTINNSFLFIEGNSREFVFSQWEYKIQGKRFSICLEEYLSVYKNIVRKTSDNRNMSNHTGFSYCTVIGVFLHALRYFIEF